MLRKLSSIQERPEKQKASFATELSRFQPFAAGARGGISVAAAQIDGTSADNIIVGSGPGIPSEVRIYDFETSRRERHGAGAVFHVQPLRQQPFRLKPDHRLRRLFDRSLQHRDCAGRPERRLR